MCFLTKMHEKCFFLSSSDFSHIMYIQSHIHEGVVFSDLELLKNTQKTPAWSKPLQKSHSQLKIRKSKLSFTKSSAEMFQAIQENNILRHFSSPKSLKFVH